MQDQWRAIEDRLWLTAGVRLERNDYSGNEYNPSLRALYQLNEGSVLWTAVTRSVSTSSRTNADACIGSPTTCVVDIRSASNDAVVTYSYELGYRRQWTDAFIEGQFEFDPQVRLDTNLIWQVNSALDLQFSLNNLLDDYHYEAQDGTRLNSSVRRGGMLLATVKF